VERILTALLLWASVAGCSTGNLTFVTYTKLGLDISAANQTPTSVLFGYKRYEGAIIPVDPGAVSPDGGEPEAMSVYAAMNLSNHWLCGLDALQVFATGEAAVKSAKRYEKFVRPLQEESAERRDYDCLLGEAETQTEQPTTSAPTTDPAAEEVTQ
jgi:hypothetical protein